MRSLIVKAILGLAVIVSCHSAAATDDLAPGFSLPGDDAVINLEDYRGKVVYLDFWASWCDPCRRSFPWMNRLHEVYNSDDFAVIAINLDASRADALAFLETNPARFDIAYDGAGDTAEAYNLKAMPSSYLIDRNGRLVKRILGYRKGERDRIEMQIREMLGSDLVASR